MAPEEILSSVDASRREFLKKVIAGTTFAVPVMASFSMEGLSAERAWASDATTSNMPLCANMPPGSPCCALAARIATGIGLLSFETGERLGSADGVGFEILGQYFGVGGGAGASPEVIAALLGPLGEAQADMADGIRKGKGDCTKGSSIAQFKKGANALATFQTRLADLCGTESPITQGLLLFSGQLTDALTDLISGNCSTPC